MARRLWPSIRGLLAGFGMFVVFGVMWTAPFIGILYLYAQGAATARTSSQLVIVAGEIVWLSGQALLIWGCYRLTLFVSEGRRSASWTVVGLGTAATLVVPVSTIITWLAG